MNKIKIALIIWSISITPAFGSDHEKKVEPTKQSMSTKVVLSFVAGASLFGALLAFPYCKSRFGSFRNCIKQLGLGGAAAGLPGGNRDPHIQERPEGDHNQLGKIQEVQRRINRTPPVIENKETLKEKMNQFMRDTYQSMSVEDQDPKRFCLRRARNIRQFWNSSNEANMGAVYVIQQENATSNVPFGGPHSWVYHVAAVYLINSEIENVADRLLVLDPIFDTVLTLPEWMRLLGLSKKHHKVVFAKPNEDYDVGFTARKIPSILVKRK